MIMFRHLFEYILYELISHWNLKYSNITWLKQATTASLKTLYLLTVRDHQLIEVT
jgi:hypothetical protein